MSNFLIETKNEYTTHLTNILAPLVFEGFQSIYKEGMCFTQDCEILKIFQTCLKNIPKWSQTIIEKETNRIINSSQSYGWLDDLIKATLKANLVVLMYNPSVKVQSKVNPDYYKHIRISDFIHKIYIECAREFWNNPYLFYHEYQPIDIKRNQRDCLVIIKECIKESIRKLLPVKQILQIYLGEELEPDEINNEFEKVLSDVEERNLKKMVNKDIHDDKPKNIMPELKALEYKEDNTKTFLQNIKNDDTKDNSSEKTIKSRILEIINDNSSQNKNDSTIFSPTSQSSETKKDTEIDNKIRKILDNELNSETDLNYTNKNTKYQEVYSNSNISPSKVNDNKYFVNYLNI